MALIGTIKINHNGNPVEVPVWQTGDVATPNIRVMIGGTVGCINVVNDGSGDLPIKFKINGSDYRAKSTI